jgi:hypothetical protein
MGGITAKFLAGLLSSDQKEHRIAVCPELKELTENDPNLISTVITVDEFWVYKNDHETKQQSSQWMTSNSP